MPDYDKLTTPLDIAEVAALEAQAEGPHGLMRITRADQLVALAHMATDTKNAFDRMVIELFQADPDRIQQVRTWRCGDPGHTWRGVAGEASAAWATEIAARGWANWGHNQLAGMALCEIAAAACKEDANAPPWN